MKYTAMSIVRALVCILSLVAACRTASCAEDVAQEGRLVTISDGIRIVLKDSRLVRMSLTDKDMAFQDSLLARSALLPHVSVSLQQGFLSKQPASRFGSQEVNTAEKKSFSYGFDVYQTLFDFGKSFSDYRAAKALVGASQANIAAVKKLAVLEFVTAYFDFLEAQKMILVAEKEVDSLSAYQKDVGHLYEQGAATKNDLLPAQVRLADAKQKLIAARNARETAAFNLNNILALPLREKIRVQDIDMGIPAVPGLEETLKTAQAERPEIEIITDQLKASVLAEAARKAGNYPSVYADGGYEYAQNKYQVHENNAYVNIGAKANIFDGWAWRAEAFKERSRQKRLQVQRDKLLEDIKFEVEDSYLGLSDAREKAEVAKGALEQAQENVRVNRLRYAEGSATTTDVLEAIAMQTGAHTNFYRADYELKRNYAKLMYSMGIDLALIYDTMKDNKKDDSPPQ
ncbi:MAG TPA: TolC family protein [Patescibacteria group bacterium]|nr:TolC family protein [Patescibacteria group bacterium]